MAGQLCTFLSFLNCALWAFDLQALLQFRPWLQSLGQTCGADSLLSELDTLQEEKARRQYMALFEGTDASVNIPLWESAYRDEQQILMSEATLQVIRCYAEALLRTADLTQPPDYIGYEAEFLLILLERKQEKQAAVFWRAHFQEFALAVFAQVAQAQQTGFYQAMAVFIQNMLRQTEIRAAENLQSGFALPTEPCHFKTITEAEREEMLTSHMIRTSGRGNCGGKCVIHAFETAGCITHLETDIEEEGSPVLHACVRGRGYRKTFLSSSRLRYPMLRVGERGEGRFRRISWEEAIDWMAEKLLETKEKWGVGSRYVNYATGVTNIIRGDRLAKRLLALDGGFLDNRLSYSSACATVGIPYTYGTDQVNSSLQTYRNAKLLILWGYNPAVTNYNPNFFTLLKYHKAHGTPIIVIDPQFSDTAAVFSTKWLPIRPGTDSALASAMAYVLWEENLCDAAFMNRYCLGFDADHMPAGYERQESFHDYIYGAKDHIVKTPEWASGITGISADEIRALARLYGSTKPAAILPGLGPQRHANGEQTVRSVTVLPCMTGNVGIAGGGTGANGRVQQHKEPSMPKAENPYRGSISVFQWTDAVLRGHEMDRDHDRIQGRARLESDVKFIFNLAGNSLLNQHSDINRTAGILRDTEKCKYIVVSDLFMTPSARFADLLLPGTSLFESDGMSAPWSDGNYLLYGNQVIPPLFESRFEFDWLKELAERMGILNLTEKCETVREWNRLIYNRLRKEEPELPDFETFAAAGGYKYQKNPPVIAFQECIQDPEHHPFPTPSGKIEIFSPALYELYEAKTIPAVPKYVPAFEGVSDPRRERYPLQLIGWHTKRRCHSIHDNNAWMEEVEPHRLWIHPEDAAERGIAEEDLVRIWNDRGAAVVKAHLSRRIMRGVVCLPQGAWYTPDARGTDIRGCVNTLTILRPTPLARGNPQHSCLVDVQLEAEAEGVGS